MPVENWALAERAGLTEGGCGMIRFGALDSPTKR